MDGRADFQGERPRRLRRNEAEPRPAVAGQTSRDTLAAGALQRLDSRLSPGRSGGERDEQTAGDGDGKHSSRCTCARFVFECEFISSILRRCSENRARQPGRVMEHEISDAGFLQDRAGDCRFDGHGWLTLPLVTRRHGVIRWGNAQPSAQCRGELVVNRFTFHRSIRHAA